MITIGDIQEKLKISNFENDSPDEFILECIIRENCIKNNIGRAFRSLNEHIEQPGIEGYLNIWQKNKVERNKKTLIKYIEKLYVKLDRKEIISYCKNKHPLQPAFYEDDEMIFWINSYYGNVLLDIMWANDISVSDVINVSKGIIDKENLAKKIPEKIKVIKREIIPFLKKHDDYKNYVDSINESVMSYKKKLYQGASLLILPTIEGIVRKLGTYLIKTQELGDKYLHKEYNSLDSFLRNIPWKEDIEIEKSRLMFITGDYEFMDERKFDKKNDNVKVNLKTRLDFLRRIFKKERDTTLHGNMENIGDSWDLYRNYSALFEVYLTLRYYLDSENN